MASSTSKHGNICIPGKLLQALSRGNQQTNPPYVEREMLKVPPLLRQEKNNQQEYDPFVVSLGPYHHGKKELQLAEDFKIKALEMLVIDSGMDILFFYTKVLELVNDARSCYINDSTSQYDDPTFAQMMLLDACFIINYVLVGTNLRNLYVTQNYLGSLNFAFLLRDLFLLENQIPFWVIKMLMCFGYGEELANEMLDDFLNSTVFWEGKKSGVSSMEPFHLLDAFWLILVSEPSNIGLTQKISPSPSEPNKLGNFSKNCFSLFKNIPKFSCQFRRWVNEDQEDYSAKKHFLSFRSASELKAKGIHFRPSRGNSIKSIKFESGYLFARLEVPTWYVSMNTKVFFLNMMAYELCPNASSNREVTAYVEFMRSLIDNRKDVKELREKKIFLTTLGNDEDVVNVYKDLNTYGLDNGCIFHHVKVEIQAHYNNKTKTWLAELCHTYFRSPWTAIALFAAIFLLLLTFLQSYFTINPKK